jgi:molybdopterin synthase catalytic subunit
MSMIVELLDRPFDAEAAMVGFSRRVAGAGAIVSFTGLARATAKDGQPIEALVLESHRSMTLRSMQQIAADALARFSIIHGLVIHRTGRVLPGEAIVLVATASLHRRAAFEAADCMMDRLKTEAVFWKREEGPNGHRWIEPTSADGQDAARWHADEARSQ